MYIYVVAGWYLYADASPKSAKVLFASSTNVERAGDSDVANVAGSVAAYKRSPIRRSKISRTTSMAESSGLLRADVFK